jgi:hypothetical protein
VPHRFASKMLDGKTIAPDTFALLRSAPVRSVALSIALMRRAFVRLDSARVARNRLVQVRLEPLKSIPLESVQLKSQYGRFLVALICFMVFKSKDRVSVEIKNNIGTKTLGSNLM